jgi:mycothiol maleylpyruvate isomerase-like protein/alpha/beta hydrolase family protein
VVLGHSWGGTVALDLAGTHPGEVSGLGLLDSPIQPLSERLTWDQAAQLMQPPLPLYQALDEAYAESAAELGEAWGPDLEPFVAASFRRDGEGWVRTLTAGVREQILRALFGFQPAVLFERVAELPVLLALAGADAGFRPWKEQGARALAAAVPDADVRWYDSRHDIPLIHPAEMAAAVERLCLRAGWRDVAREVSRLDGEWDAPAGEGEWSAKDLLAHLSSTQAAMGPLLTRPPAPAGGEPFDSDRWNASQVRKRRELPASELQDEMARGTREVDASLLGVDLEAPMPGGSEVGRTIASGMRAMARHQREHLVDLQAALGREVGRPA